VLAVHLVGLAAEHRDEANAVAAQPGHGGSRPIDESPGQVLVGLVAGDLHQLLVEMLAIVRRQVDLLGLGLGQVVENVRSHVIQSVVGESKAAGREVGVATLLLLRSLFQNQHPGATLVRAQRRTQSRVAGSHDYHVITHGRTSSCSRPMPVESEILSQIVAGVSQRGAVMRRSGRSSADHPPAREADHGQRRPERIYNIISVTLAYILKPGCAAHRLGSRIRCAVSRRVSRNFTN
jgi:hypothetical protein